MVESDLCLINFMFEHGTEVSDNESQRACSHNIDFLDLDLAVLRRHLP